MAFFPLEPSHARAILASKEHGCTADMLEIVSVLSTKSKLFFESTKQQCHSEEESHSLHHASGDHLTILNAVKAYRDVAKAGTKGGRKEWCRKHRLNERTLAEATKIRDQLRKVCTRLGIDWTSSSSDDWSLLISLGCGLIQNAAFLQPGGSYRQIMGSAVSVSAACLL